MPCRTEMKMACTTWAYCNSYFLKIYWTTFKINRQNIWFCRQTSSVIHQIRSGTLLTRHCIQWLFRFQNNRFGLHCCTSGNTRVLELQAYLEMSLHCRLLGYIWGNPCGCLVQLRILHIPRHIRELAKACAQVRSFSLEAFDDAVVCFSFVVSDADQNDFAVKIF